MQSNKSSEWEFKENRDKKSLSRDDTMSCRFTNPTPILSYQGPEMEHRQEIDT